MTPKVWQLKACLQVLQFTMSMSSCTLFQALLYSKYWYAQSKATITAGISISHCQIWTNPFLMCCTSDWRNECVTDFVWLSVYTSHSNRLPMSSAQAPWYMMECCTLISHNASIPDMTYNVFSGTLNPTQSDSHNAHWQHLQPARCHQWLIPRHQHSMFGCWAFSVAGPTGLLCS